MHLRRQKARLTAIVIASLCLVVAPAQTANAAKMPPSYWDGLEKLRVLVEALKDHPAISSTSLSTNERLANIKEAVEEASELFMKVEKVMPNRAFDARPHDKLLRIYQDFIDARNAANTTIYMTPTEGSLPTTTTDPLTDPPIERKTGTKRPLRRPPRGGGRFRSSIFLPLFVAWATLPQEDRSAIINELEQDWVGRQFVEGVGLAVEVIDLPIAAVRGVALVTVGLNDALTNDEVAPTDGGGGAEGSGGNGAAGTYGDFNDGLVPVDEVDKRFTELIVSEADLPSAAPNGGGALGTSSPTLRIPGNDGNKSSWLDPIIDQIHNARVEASKVTGINGAGAYGGNSSTGSTIGDAIRDRYGLKHPRSQSDNNGSDGAEGSGGNGISGSGGSGGNGSQEDTLPDVMEAAGRLNLHKKAGNGDNKQPSASTDSSGTNSNGTGESSSQGSTGQPSGGGTQPSGGGADGNGGSSGNSGGGAQPSGGGTGGNGSGGTGTGDGNGDGDEDCPYAGLCVTVHPKRVEGEKDYQCPPDNNACLPSPPPGESSPPLPDRLSPCGPLTDPGENGGCGSGTIMDPQTTEEFINAMRPALPQKGSCDDVRAIRGPDSSCGPPAGPAPRTHNIYDGPCSPEANPGEQGSCEGALKPMPQPNRGLVSQ